MPMSMPKQQRGVTAIEYAILVSLIALTILGAITAAGEGNGGIWTYWTNAFIQAVSSVLN